MWPQFQVPQAPQPPGTVSLPVQYLVSFAELNRFSPLNEDYIESCSTDHGLQIQAKQARAELITSLVPPHYPKELAPGAHLSQARSHRVEQWRLARQHNFTKEQREALEAQALILADEMRQSSDESEEGSDRSEKDESIHKSTESESLSEGFGNNDDDDDDFNMDDSGVDEEAY